MSEDHKDPGSHREQLNEQISDGGGCTETWETLSGMREETGRRNFLSHVGMTLGVLSIGGSAVSASASAAVTTSEPQVNIESLEGRERALLLWRAYRSEDLRKVVRALGERPKATKVFEYTSDDASGYGVTFGEIDEDCTTIHYKESPSIEGGSTAYGGKPEGDGVRAVETKEGSIMSIGTPLVRDVASRLSDNKIDTESGNQSVKRDQSILVQDLEDAKRFDLYLPVVRDDEVVGRTILTANTRPEHANSSDFHNVSPQGSGGVSTQSHKICDPWGWVCTDYCQILCGTIGALAGTACVAKCSATIAGIPISPACGALCATSVGVTCYESCKNQVGH